MCPAQHYHLVHKTRTKISILLPVNYTGIVVPTFPLMRGGCGCSSCEDVDAISKSVAG